jgi:hypothetical protein
MIRYLVGLASAFRKSCVLLAIGQPGPEAPFPSVSAGADVLADGVGMLVEQGHRQLAYVADPRGFTHSDIRRRQVQQAARALRLPRVCTRGTRASHM